jgi:hypothetical protein
MRETEEHNGSKYLLFQSEVTLGNRKEWSYTPKPQGLV